VWRYNSTAHIPNVRTRIEESQSRSRQTDEVLGGILFIYVLLNFYFKSSATKKIAT